MTLATCFLECTLTNVQGRRAIHLVQLNVFRALHLSGSHWEIHDILRVIRGEFNKGTISQVNARASKHNKPHSVLRVSNSKK